MQNNSDKFDHLISLSAIKCTEEDAKDFNDLDTSDVVFDSSYYRKRNKIIKRGWITYSVIQPYEFVLTDKRRHFVPKRHKNNKHRHIFFRDL